MNPLIQTEISQSSNQEKKHCSKPSLKLIYKRRDIIIYFILTLEQNTLAKGMTSFDPSSAIKADKHEKFLPVIDW